MKRLSILAIAVVMSVACLVLAGSYGASLYYAAGHGSGCADCHEMAEQVSAVHGSPHYNAQCTDCHNAGVRDKLRHVVKHFTTTFPDGIHLRQADAQSMIANCQSCHQHETASWHAGPHSATFRQIFLDTSHNTRRRLNDDCLRCHGMYFDGAMRELVQPQDTRGPWRLKPAGLVDEPAIPCLACHWIHREGLPQSKPLIAHLRCRPSGARFARPFTIAARSCTSAPPSSPFPYSTMDPARSKSAPTRARASATSAMRRAFPEAASPAAVNQWGPQAGSGDDRTPLGVHEGLSCLACHTGHNESARASCATCHPALSNCGLDVEKMDTTFANPKSAHNIHWVKCMDCHQHGVPKSPRRDATRIAQDEVPGMGAKIAAPTP